MTKDHAGVLIPPPIIFVVPLLAASFVDSLAPWPIAQEHSTLRLLGAFVAIATGVSLGLGSVGMFRSADTTVLPMGRPTTAIVEQGPYAFSRNPMYLAMAIGYIGLSLLLNNLWAIVFLPAVVLVIDVFVIRREERYLAGKFGEPYRSYCSRVRRWL